MDKKIDDMRKVINPSSTTGKASFDIRSIILKNFSGRESTMSAEDNDWHECLRKAIFLKRTRLWSD